jgi:acyl-CoA reductase-like NAD-dependent aldehyde dehydrogenase
MSTRGDTTSTATQYGNLIGGAWRAPASAEYFEDRNPANTSEVVGLFPRSGAEDATAAVDAANGAFDGWRRELPVRRGGYLLRAAAIVRGRLEEITRDFVREEGKPIKEARAEVLRAAEVLEYFAGEGARMSGETLPSSRPGVFLYTLRRPLGVVGIITPWNFPIAIPAWKLAPALVCGNTAVLKPASQAPLAPWHLVNALHEAGLPAGVVNFVTGPGAAVGSALIEHPAVRAISFTGSTEIGTRVYQSGSQRGARVQCEMGGKNPLVVLADADLETAVRLTLEGAFSGTGQKCTATSRVIVEQPLHDAFLSRLVEAAKMLTVGNPLDEDTFVGPVVDESQMTKVLNDIDIGRREGAELLCGGRRLTERGLQRGYFVEPTVFARVTPDMRIAQEEIFGPVVAVMPARDFDDTVALANRTRYGLAASIVTGSLAKAHAFTERVEAGLVMVNLPTVGVEYQAPFGGTKASGTAFKEQGKVAVDFYTEVRTVAMRPSMA